MSDTILIGDKEDFAIQLGLHANIEKCKLCFWVQGRKMGSFTKGGELKYSIKAYNQFIADKESYYLSVFDKMTPTQINHYLVNDLFSLGRSPKKEKMEEYEKRKKIHLFFGGQFTNDGCDIIVLYKDSKVIFVYRPPKKAISHTYNTSYGNFCKVFDEYIEYCNEHSLL